MAVEYYISSTKYSLKERTTKRSGKVYDVIFRIVTLDGEEKQKKLSGFKTKKEASQAHADFITQKCELVKVKPVRKETPKPESEVRASYILSDLYREYIATLFNQNKVSTIYDKQHTYRAYIAPTLGNADVRTLTTPALYKWQDELWGMKNPKTGEYFTYKYLAKIRGFLFVFLSWVETRYGVPNNLKNVKRPKNRAQKTEMKIWTREDFERFIAVVDDPMLRAFFTVLFYTGCRKGEALALSPADILPTSIQFNKSVTRKAIGATWAVTSTKAEKRKAVPVCQRVQGELKSYMATEGVCEQKFLFGGDRPLGDNYTLRAFKLYCEAAGVERIRIHDLRHSFVSMCMHLGANYNVIADLIGDTVEQVIKTYGHMYVSDKQAVVDMLG